MTECRAGKRDGCAVPRGALAGVVQGWIDRWDRDHPDLVATRRNRGAIGAATILHERTQQIDPDGRGVSPDSLRKLLDGRAAPYTELRTADMLVAAVEMPEAWHDGTLSVVPNPYASSDARSSCCGGSSSGSLNGSLG